MEEVKCTINWNGSHIRVTGRRTFMVKQMIKSALTYSNTICCGYNTDLTQFQSMGLERSMEETSTSFSNYFQHRVELLERLKENNSFIQNKVIFHDAEIQNLIEQISGLEKKEAVPIQCSEIQITHPYLLATEKQMAYYDTIHEKVDMILKGTENDPIGRAQFDNFISRISHAYEEENLDRKAPKEK